ncbi:oligosaccharide flippase family protein [Thermodesulfovibrio sp.]|uniref:oligosaccharide flippase family protein n=1 Tax=Thermodesulfovibrio sp. TaxID=2067987 RepID=UPI0030B14E37
MNAIGKIFQTLIGHFLLFAQGLILTPIVIKVSGAETYGKYILIASYLGIMFGISSFGIGIYAKRRLPICDLPNERAKLFFPQFTFQLAMISCLSIASMFSFKLAINKGWLNLQDFMIILILFYLVSYTLYSQTTDYFRYTHKVWVFNLATVGQPYLFIGIALAIFFMTDKLNPNTLVLSSSIASLLVSIPLIRYLYKEIGFSFRLPNITELIAELKVGFPSVLTYLVDTILVGGDRYIIAAILSVRDVGIYAPAYAIGSLIILIPKVFGVVLPPLLFRYVDLNDFNSAKNLISCVIRLYLLVSIPYVVGSWVLGERILSLYTTAEIAEKAWPVIPIVATGMIFYGLILINSNILYLKLQLKSLFSINAVAAVLNIVLNIVFLKIIPDVVIAAIVTLLSYLSGYLLLLKQIRSEQINSAVNLKWLFCLLLASAMMGIAGFWVSNNLGQEGFSAIILGIFVGVCVYLVILYIFRLASVEFRYITKWLHIHK